LRFDCTVIDVFYVTSSNAVIIFARYLALICTIPFHIDCISVGATTHYIYKSVLKVSKLYAARANIFAKIIELCVDVNHPII
jgi:hypothetical protein